MKTTELDRFLQSKEISHEVLQVLNPFHKVKRVMQMKSRSSPFGRAFEKAVIEALLEVQEEKA